MEGFGSDVPRRLCAKKNAFENQMCMFQMIKGEEIDPFFFRLQAIRDQLIGMGAALDERLLARTTLNVVSEEWETFVQSILGRATLPSWEDMWAILRQEEIRRITKKQSNSGGSGSARLKKEDEEDAALAPREKKQGKKKKDLSKVWCFNCGDLGHFTNSCPKKKDKGASDSKAATTNDDGSDDDVAMSAHAPREKRWGDMDI